MIYIQVGAGAGDRDIRSGYKDGFTNYLKSISLDINDRIILIEPNPINIPYLEGCWENHLEAEIYQIGICLEELKNQSITFYYADEDGPHFQVFSMNREHVSLHYPDNIIKEKVIECLSLKEFIQKYVGNEKIEILALDIEGIDADILLETDFNKVNCNVLSFEYIHLGDKSKKVFNKLATEGFIFVGRGFDHNAYDYMFKKISANSILRPFLIEINFLKITMYKFMNRFMRA
jgi:FkbM family methyltransferase